MKRTERQALVKGMDVVYIYHDKVDEASHTSDSMVFPACEDAITEIKNIVRIICNEFGGTRIYITADHGFLYTYSPLTEDDKVDRAGFVNRVLEYGRRFALMQKNSNPDYLIPVKFLDGRSDMDAYAPRENVRIKMNGSGLNFVHGGISLQEMVVPVIEENPGSRRWTCTSTKPGKIRYQTGGGESAFCRAEDHEYDFLPEFLPERSGRGKPLGLQLSGLLHGFRR